ncbi:MAG: hypothetical protein RLZZ241_2003 [Bacteroidota bacterium]|jgi:photosystem II stability/assembly factor-like uncharacterized protein
MKKAILSAFVLLLTLSISAQDLNSYLAPVKFRNIGPFRGGRSTGSTGVVGDPLTYYMGTTGGGLWKTTDAGNNWNNVSDGFFKTGSVGTVTVSESHPNVVYVGMGEHAPRGVMTSYGDGVYKSTDAGKTWQHMGLEQTRHIARIVVHPDNPDLVWVAAQGALHGPNKERGIYKSEDGGKTWKHVLYVNDKTGCNDLSIDVHNPQVLYASMWEHMRTPWQVISGGPGSGLYKSTDGGETWSKIHKGLPEEKGKMAIAVSRANSDRVYALIESDSQAEKGGLFSSSNGGDSWTRVSDDHRLLQRAWYYIEITADPKDENTVYVMSAATYRSIDGGTSWEEISSNHGDYHDLWINPNNPKNMVISDDGGAEVSFDGGATWSAQDKMPTAQFYRISTDSLFPYNIYGGQQDNTSVKISSIGLGSYGIGQEHWEASAGGESAFLAFDPKNPVKVMGGSYLGYIELLDVPAQVGTLVMIEPNLYLGLPARDMKYLFNWNAPIIKSMHEPNTYYHGAQYLLRTYDEGMSWDVVSPDLTRNQDDKQGNGGAPYTNEAVGAENYGTLSYVIESPHEAGVLYTGSDDGFVHITRDNGKTWVNITPKGLPETLINAIEVSPHDPATVYIATTRYKFNDHTPALYKSTDYGKSWKNISAGIPLGSYTRVVREDNERKDLLFAGTETGIFVSFNGGAQWEPLKGNLPVVPVTDLQVRFGDLIVATQGRSFWILDDLGLIRQYGTANAAGHLYRPEDTTYPNWYSSLNSNSATGTNSSLGVNPASGMPIYYELPELPENTEVKLEIRDNSGNLVRAYSSLKDANYVSYEGAPSPATTLSTKKGLNRLVWDLRYGSLPGVPKVYIEGSYRGHKAIPGRYTIALKFGSSVFTTEAVLTSNPLIPTTEAEFLDYHEFMSQSEATYTEMTEITNQMYRMQDRLKALQSHLKELGKTELFNQAGTLLSAMDAWDKLMVQRLSKAYDDVENFVNGFTAEYITAFNHADSAIPRVNSGTKQKVSELNTVWKTHKGAAIEILEKQVPAFNLSLQQAGIGVLY